MDFIKEALGIDYIVNPDLSITMEIYKYLVEKYTLSNGIFSTGNVSLLLEFPANKMNKILNHPMTDMPKLLPGMLVAAVSRNGKVIVPHGSTIVQEGDGLYVVGKKKEIAELNKKVHEKGKYTDIQKVMILGGGKTECSLPKTFNLRSRCKDREIDKARCHYLATVLNNVMILHGDATDVNLLEQENWTGMDAAFVAVTGHDEENLLLALIKQNNIEDVIAKISRESYSA